MTLGLNITCMWDTVECLSAHRKEIDFAASRKVLRTKHSLGSNTARIYALYFPVKTNGSTNITTERPY